MNVETALDVLDEMVAAGRLIRLHPRDRSKGQIFQFAGPDGAMFGLAVGNIHTGDAAKSTKLVMEAASVTGLRSWDEIGTKTSGVALLPDPDRRSVWLEHPRLSPDKQQTCIVENPSALRALLDWYTGADDQIDQGELEKLKAQFLKIYPAFQGLGFPARSGPYWKEERQFKQALIDRAQAAVQAHATSDGDLGSALLKLLLEKLPDKDIQSTILVGPWRTQQRIADLRKRYPGEIEQAVGRVARKQGAEIDGVTAFIDEVWPLFLKESEGQSKPYAEIRAIPTMLMALVSPNDAIGIRYQAFRTAGQKLLHKELFANAPLTAQEYALVLNMARQIFAVMKNKWKWEPQDLWDVQGFLWVTCGSNDSGQVATESVVEDDKQMNRAESVTPTNLILYGPPGTGKTYETAREAVRLCVGDVAHLDDDAIILRYRTLVQEKRISFVTFHQSYSYEDFIEGLRPETGTDENEGQASGVGFRLLPRPGTFKAICERAEKIQGSAGHVEKSLEGRRIFKMSLGRSGSSEDAPLFEDAIKGGYVSLGYGGEIDWSDPRFDDFDEIKREWQKHEPNATGQNPNIQQIYALRGLMRPGDLIIVSKGNRYFRAVGEVTGPYSFFKDSEFEHWHRRPVKWLWTPDEGLPVSEIYSKTFSQVALYELHPKNLNRSALARIIEGGKDPTGPAIPYVLIIDEINRANISKVFGELITLIEADKRLGMKHELKVTLPYSQKEFGVPANLHIIGTMNTADRSIALLDTALRRRFRFREIMPKPELLLENVEGVNLHAVLRAINDRIEHAFDRDHQIGHAYFFNCRTLAEINAVMRDAVIPLLCEYFHENWGKVRFVLNEPDDSQGNFIDRTEIVVRSKLNGESGMEERRWRYAVKSGDFSADAYSRLIE